MKGSEEMIDLNHRYPLALGFALLLFLPQALGVRRFLGFLLYRIKDDLEVSWYEIYII